MRQHMQKHVSQGLRGPHTHGHLLLLLLHPCNMQSWPVVPQEQHSAWHRAPANNSPREHQDNSLAHCPCGRSAHPQCRHHPRVSTGSTPREAASLSTPAPTPLGLSSKACLQFITEQNTQEVKQGPAPRPRVTPSPHCAGHRADVCGPGQNGQLGMGMRIQLTGCFSPS